MGKQGPCYHCGVTSTPLWRNGPPEKPVLCNACGSRWRTKGTLANYAPLHARAEPDDLEDLRVSRVRVMPINKQKEPKMLKRKQIADSMIVGAATSDNNQGFHWVMDEDTSNRSSSGSAISNSESCAQFGSADASDLTGPAQSVVWDSMVPSRKRTCVNRPKPSSVEKLTKDLYTILHEQRSYFSGSSEEDLLFESDIPMVSVEIGHGSVLIRHPSSIAREEESEASSLSFDIKAHPTNEAYSHCGALPLNFENKSVKFRSPEIKHMNPIIDQGMQQEQVKRDKTQHEKLPILGFRNSPLRNVDLKDVLNFKDFIEHLTNEEQQRLLKYLPPVDSVKFPESLNNMFNSPQFLENLSSFQKLLEEGVLDSSISGVKREDCRTLKRLVLFDMKTSKWVEHYNMLKKCKNSTFASWTGGGFKGSTRNHMVDMKTLRDCQNQHVPEATATPTRNPIKVVIKKTSHENKQQTDSDGSCFSPRSLFALPPDNSSLMLDSFQLIDESSDHDLLLEVPSNSSFPQAELLFPTTQQGSACSSSIYPPPP